MSGASEEVHGRASDLVLQSVFLVILAHSAFTFSDCKKLINESVIIVTSCKPAMQSVMRMMQRMIRMMAKQLVQHLSVSMMRIPAIDQMSVVKDVSVVKDASVVQNMTMAIMDAVSMSVPVSISASVMDLIDAVMSESVSVRASVMGRSVHVVNGVGQMMARDFDLVRVILTLDFLSFCCHVFTIYQ